MYTDEFGNHTLETGEFSQTIPLKVKVLPTDCGGGTRIVFCEGDRMRFGVDLCAEAVDELIQAIHSVLESESANWPHLWSKVPNKNHDPNC